MFASDDQKCRAIRALLKTVRIDRLWGDDGPTPHAVELLEARGGYLSTGETLMLLLAFDLWNGDGKAPFGDVAYRIDPNNLRAVATLLVAIADRGDELSLTPWTCSQRPGHLPPECDPIEAWISASGDHYCEKCTGHLDGMGRCVACMYDSSPELEAHDKAMAEMLFARVESRLSESQITASQAPSAEARERVVNYTEKMQRLQHAYTAQERDRLLARARVCRHIGCGEHTAAPHELCPFCEDEVSPCPGCGHTASS